MPLVESALPTPGTDPETGMRFYTWNGVEYPSVTTLRRMAGMSFPLHQWAVSQVVNRAVDNIGDLNRMLTSNDPLIIAAAKRGCATPRTRSVTGSSLGKRVHKAAEENKPLGSVDKDVLLTSASTSTGSTRPASRSSALSRRCSTCRRATPVRSTSSARTRSATSMWSTSSRARGRIPSMRFKARRTRSASSSARTTSSTLRPRTCSVRPTASASSTCRRPSGSGSTSTSTATWSSPSTGCSPSPSGRMPSEDG